MSRRAGNKEPGPHDDMFREVGEQVVMALEESIHDNAPVLFEWECALGLAQIQVKIVMDKPNGATEH